MLSPYRRSRKEQSHSTTGQDNLKLLPTVCKEEKFKRKWKGERWESPEEQKT
jgi:hypothetical protein